MGHCLNLTPAERRPNSRLTLAPRHAGAEDLRPYPHPSTQATMGGMHPLLIVILIESLIMAVATITALIALARS